MTVSIYADDSMADNTKQKIIQVVAQIYFLHHRQHPDLDPLTSLQQKPFSVKPKSSLDSTANQLHLHLQSVEIET